jgi:hypothetical protein
MARATSDFIAPLIVSLVAVAALVMLLAARVHLGSPPPQVAQPRREVVECGNEALERLLDAVHDEATEGELGRRLGAALDHCRRWWFDPKWAYSPCRLPGYDDMVRRLIDRIFFPTPQVSPHAARETERVKPTPESAVLHELLNGCERLRNR